MATDDKIVRAIKVKVDTLRGYVSDIEAKALTIGPIPVGPRRELIKLLERLRKAIDRQITSAEKRIAGKHKEILPAASRKRPRKS